MPSRLFDIVTPGTMEYTGNGLELLSYVEQTEPFAIHRSSELIRSLDATAGNPRGNPDNRSE